MPCYIKHIEPRVDTEFGRLVKIKAHTLFMCGRDIDDPHCFGCGDVGD